MKRGVLIALLLILLCLLLAWWWEHQHAQPPATACQPAAMAQYFPYQVGTHAVYAGIGNEYAAYSTNTILQGSGKAEWRKNNGGTQLAEVFQVTPTAVTMVYQEAEVYNNNSHLNSPPNTNQVILQAPIQVGTTWTSNGATYQIISTTATVTALNNQTLTCAVQVRATSGSGVNDTYFHPTYGIVRNVVGPGPNQVESVLSTFTP